MIQSELTCGTRLPSIHPMHQEKGDPWAVVLAGGEGVRLRPLIRQLYGEERPKQYAVLTGSKSLLRQTLDRVALLIQPRRTVVVTQASHVRYLTEELAECPEVHVLPQPSDKGTAGAVLLAAHWIGVRDPQATVVVFPADHFIREETLFMRHVAEMATYVGAHPEWLVLSGARPTGPETDYGWIEPGERVGWAGRCPVYRVRGFREKPSRELARGLFMGGGLWNTFVFATSIGALIEAGRECLPLLHDRLIRLCVFVGTQVESWALRQAYVFAPTADFSRTVLGSSALALAVAPAPALMWCDLGTPERVARTLRTLGTSPAWLATIESSA